MDDGVTGRKAVVERFRRFAGGPEPDLFEGALLVSELVEPREDIARARERVEALAARVRKARRDETTAGVRNATCHAGNALGRFAVRP